MSSRIVLGSRFPRRAMLTGAAAVLAGCAMKPVAIDRQAMGAVKSVALPTTGFDPHAFFQDQLTANLKTLGLAVEPEAADGTRREFVPAASYPADVDAALDVYVSGYGFFAFTDSDDSPYRPGVSLSMRLVSMRDRSVLMQDQVANTGIDAPVGKQAGAVPPSFTSFSDVTGNPELAMTALRLALTYAAGTVGSRLS